MPSISEKSGVEGTFRALGAYIFSERLFFDKKYRFRHAQQFGGSASVGAPPITPPSFSLCLFLQV
nr:MAG TPA: hypothetical protein [Caudoviricetes sp.]